jgi:hypothetical protein
MSAARFELEIGELVLIGFPEREGERVAAALEAELARLCAAGAGPSCPSLLEEARAEPIALGPRARPERVGSDAARSIFRRVVA